jgi:hypothetical protein
LIYTLYTIPGTDCCLPLSALGSVNHQEHLEMFVRTVLGIEPEYNDNEEQGQQQGHEEL